MTQVLDYVTQNPILAVIVGCEIGFWVVLLAGLFARYVLRKPKLGAVLLVCTPLMDVILLVATVLDLRRGGEATMAHGMAAIYLGVSVAFGHSMLRWADARFHHKFAGGPPPIKPPKYGKERVKYEWREWIKFAMAWAISCTVMAALVYVVGTPETTTVLWDFAMPTMSIIGVIWLLGWPVWVTFSPPQPKKEKVRV